MFRFIMRKLHFLHLLHHNPLQDKNKEPEKDPATTLLTKDLQQNLAKLKKILGTSNDIIIRTFTFGSNNIEAALIFLDGMVDKTTVNESILLPLMYEYPQSKSDEDSSWNNIEDIQQKLITVGEVKKTYAVQDTILSILSGDSILLINDLNQALIISTRGWEARGITEPQTEATVRGPRESFTETLRTNTTLLRRKLKDPNFTLETLVLGKRTQTDVAIAYLKGIVNPRLIEEIKRRLNQIDTDAILESGYIEEYIEDNPFSPFATIANSEKPDVIAAKLLEGRAAILVDGTPFVLTVPMLFVESFQTAEDYYSRAYYTSILRLLRFLSFLLSILSPALYVALTTFHQELIPTPLLLTMAAAREGTPFPAMVEAIGMGIIFEILREAGVRLPRPVGQAISIVGALVIGDAAVSAGLVGAPMVIVVALTAIASFVVPAQTDVGSILRIFLTLLAGFLGAFGIAIGILGVLVHMCALRSFGTPYLSPLAPLSTGDLKDVFIRVPLWDMFARPRTIGWIDPQRQAFRLKPEPPPKKD